MRVGIVYGSTTGNTETAASLLCTMIKGAQMNAVEKITKADLEAFDCLFLGASTWGFGDLQDDWSDNIECLRGAKLQGKTVAIFGLGDQACYSSTFVDGMKVIYDAAIEAGATVVGHCPVDGYDFSDSIAVVDGQFCGLPLDQENQADMTEDRLSSWSSKVLQAGG